METRLFDYTDTSLVIECFDFNSRKMQKSMEDLEKLHREKIGESFYLPSSTGKNHMKMLNGQLFVDRFNEKTRYRFLDYISLLQMEILVSQLPCIDPSGRLNAYQQAIFEVGEVIQFYDSDKLFPAWGIGGRPIDGVVSHCFNLNGSPSEFEVEGINGIMSA